LPVYNCAANTLTRLGRPAEALDLLNSRLRKTNWDAQTYVCAAKAYLALDQAEEAVALLTSRPRTNQDLDLYCCLATAYNQLRRYQNTLNLLKNLPPVFWNATIFQCAAIANNGLGHYALAITMLTSLDKNRWTIEIYCTIASAKISLKDYQGALDILGASPMEFRSNNINYTNCLASAYNGLGRYEETIGLLHNHASPTKESHIILAAAYIQLQQFREALNVLSLIPPKRLDVPAIDYVAAAHIGLGEPQAALDYLARFPLEQWRASTYVVCSQAYYDLGKIDLALQQDDTARSLDQEVATYSYRAMILRRQGQFEEAESFAKQQLAFIANFPAFTPNSKQITVRLLITLGFILHEKPEPDYTQSVDNFIKAYDKGPHRDLFLTCQIFRGLLTNFLATTKLGEGQVQSLIATHPRLKAIILDLDRLLTSKSSELTHDGKLLFQAAQRMKPTLERYFGT
jgi:tetratricopeptide (TPR) repeat protein